MNQIKQLTFDELISRESRAIATDLIERELSRHDLPLPKDGAMEVHIAALLRSKPELIDLAKQRVEARQDAYSTSLEALGISTEIIKPIEIEI